MIPLRDALINGLSAEASASSTRAAATAGRSALLGDARSVRAGVRVSDALGSVRDLGLRIFQETKSYSDRPDSNEPIDGAREKMAWAIMNGDSKWGFARENHASTASPIEPSSQELDDPAILATYQSSMRAAREAFLGGQDPTYGALHFNARTDPGLYDWKPKGMTGPGKPIKTHSGPYNNSYTKGDTPSSVAWLNTYED